MAGPDTDSEPVVFDRSDARRIRETVLYHERMMRNGRPDQEYWRTRNLLRHAYVTVGISARAGTTPGNGKARLIHVHGVTISADNPEVIVDVSNIFAAAVAVNTYIIVAPIDGGYSLVAADCP